MVVCAHEFGSRLLFAQQAHSFNLANLWVKRLFYSNSPIKFGVFFPMQLAKSAQPLARDLSFAYSEVDCALRDVSPQKVKPLIAVDL